jgi:excisionase family DNA binding protein
MPEEVTTRTRGRPMDSSLRLMTISEAAEVLNVPEGWLRKKVSAGAVPFTRLGKHVRFSHDHLDRLIASGEAPTCQERPATSGISPRATRARPVPKTN